MLQQERPRSVLAPSFRSKARTGCSMPWKSNSKKRRPRTRYAALSEVDARSRRRNLQYPGVRWRNEERGGV